MLRYNRNRARGRFFPLFSPRELFYGSVPGAWYDPTDLSTMFQDSAGTTPVTAVEQPVGLILDKSQGLALGADVVTNGDFSSGASWVLEPGWAIGAGLATKTAGVAASIYQPAPAMVQGRTYLVTFTVSGYTAGILYPVCRGTLGTGVTANGTYTQALIAGATAARAVEFFANATFAGSLDNVIVRELAGNHASQSSNPSRPTYRARYNLLTYSEDFGNAAWSKIGATVATDTTTAPDGTTTADTITATGAFGGAQQSLTRSSAVVVYTASAYLKASTKSVGRLTMSSNATANGVFADFTLTGAGSATAVSTYGAGWVAGVASITSVGNGWYRCTVSGTSPASTDLAMVTGHPGTAVAGDAIFAWGAQLLTAADVTATGNAYQRIAAATVYDTAPIFRPYLAFDGMDDSLATAAINFTATDKMTVFAGASKLSDAASGNLVELSANKNLNAGTFYMWFPELSPTGDITWVTRGTVNTSGFARIAIAAPATAVVTGTGDIPGDNATLRVNNASNTTTSDQGAGTFGTYPLYIGRRGGVSQPFNGRLYSLIVRGAASSVTEIADTELWVNARTGGY